MPVLGSIASSISGNLGVPVTYLVVAGGGTGGVRSNFMGGFYPGSGAGAGGMATGSLLCSKGTALTVTVGAGGATGSGYNPPGNPSVFSTITAVAGGSGESNAPISQTPNGGSGGGSYGLTGQGTGTTGQGNNGGLGGGSTQGAGGGGGAGAVGGNNATTAGGAGGAGASNSITGTAVVYAGGGGGGGGAGGGGAGGTGGGGAGGTTDSSGTSGTANTGGGGGGVGTFSNSGATPTQGGGGSGIVIISYPTSYGLASATTGSPTQTTVSTNYVYKWTGSGSITF